MTKQPEDKGLTAWWALDRREGEALLDNKDPNRWPSDPNTYTRLYLADEADARIAALEALLREVTSLDVPTLRDGTDTWTTEAEVPLDWPERRDALLQPQGGERGEGS